MYGGVGFGMGWPIFNGFTDNKDFQNFSNKATKNSFSTSTKLVKIQRKAKKLILKLSYMFPKIIEIGLLT